MTEAAKPPATTKNADPRRRGGRKPGQKPYSLEQRAVALSVLDFCDGNVARAAQETGIERKTLFKWRDEMRPEATQKALTDGSLNLVAKLTKMAESLCVIALTKAQTASLSEIRKLLDVIRPYCEVVQNRDW